MNTKTVYLICLGRIVNEDLSLLVKMSSPNLKRAPLRASAQEITLRNTQVNFFGKIFLVIYDEKGYFARLYSTNL